LRACKLDRARRRQRIHAGHILCLWRHCDISPHYPVLVLGRDNGQLLRLLVRHVLLIGGLVFTRVLVVDICIPDIVLVNRAELPFTVLALGASQEARVVLLRSVRDFTEVVVHHLTHLYFT
jgi:hypothetical protein